MQAVADLGVLDLAQPAVDVQQEVVEAVVVGAVLQAEVVVEPGGLDEGPDLGADRRELRRVHGGDLGVLVEQLFQARDVAVGVGAGHGRHEVVDEGGVHAALGLGALTGIVDDERVDEGQIAEHGVGRATAAQPEPLARQPLHRAVLAHVHDRVGAEAPLRRCSLQPPVRRHVVVGRRHVRVVVDRDRVLAEAARRLDHDDDVPEPQRGEDDVLPVDVQRTRRLPPRLQHGGFQVRVELVEPRPVVGERHARGRGGQLLLGEPLHVVPAGLDEPVDQLVTVVGVLGEPVPRLLERVQHPHRRRGRVQADRVADARVLGRVRGEDQGELLLGVRLVPQPCVPYGDPGDPRGPLRVGDVHRHLVPALLLEGERDRDQPPVELRDRDLHRRVHGRQGGVRGVPGGARGGQAQPLQHGHVQLGQPADVPCLLVAARRGPRGVRAAGREDGGDHGVGLPEQLVQPGVGTAQRTAVHGQGVGVPRLDRVAQGVHERGVAAQLVGPVEEHADGRTALLEGPVPVDAVLGHLPRLDEPLAGQQHAVGEEPGEFGEVGGAALDEVLQRLGHHPGRDGRLGHQLRVGDRLAAQQHGPDARRPERGQPVLPGALAAQQTDDRDVRARDERGEFGRDVDTGRVADPVAGTRGTGREQVRVGGRQQQHSAHAGAPGGMKGSPRGAPDSMSRHSASVSACCSIRSPSRSSCSSRSAANDVSGAGTKRRPAADATSRRKARRKPSDSRPVRAPRLTDPAAVQEGFPTGHLGDSVVDLVARDPLPEGLALRPGEGLLAGEPHPHGQDPEPVDMPAPALDVVLDVLAEDLEAPADTEDGPLLGGPAHEGVGESPLAQPLQGPDGSPGAGDHHQVRVGQFLRTVHEPHHDTRLGGQGVDVGEVGHQRDGADGDPQHVLAEGRRDDGLPHRSAQGHPQPVLLVDTEPVPEGQHAVRPAPGEVVEHVQARLQQGDVPAELVDEEPGDTLLVLARQQRDRPEERGEDTAPVDVTDDEHGKPGAPGDPHVHDVGPPQIDLGGRTGPLTDHRVIRAPQLLQTVQHRPEQPPLPSAVVPARAQLAHRLAQQRPPACPAARPDCSARHRA